MAYATADNAHPVQMGFYGIFEVFVDTFVICVLTGLAILVTGTMTYYPELTGAQLALQSFEVALGTPGKYILATGLLLFATTTILGWYWYAETAVTYLFGVRFKSVMKLLLIVMIVLGASGAQMLDASGNDYLNNIWNISDTLIGLMAFPNLISLLLLSLTLRRLVKNYDAQKAVQKVCDVPEKKPMSKELRNLLLVSACAALLPLALIAFVDSSREEVRLQDVSLQTVLNSGRFVVGVDDNFPPMSFTDENGELVGFDIDLSREISSRLGVTSVVRPIAWKDKEEELDSRKIDCIGSMSVTPQAVKTMSISEAYIKDNLVFVVRGDSNIMWLSDIKGKKIGIQTGSTTDDVFRKSEFNKDAVIVPLMDNVAVLQQVKEGNVDVGFVDSLAAFYFIRSSSDRYFILPDSLSEEDLALGFRKNDKELRNMVQKILSEMKADGTLGKISQKWFKSDIIIVR
jgi:AGCS family alanine or glycine:cation symporter